MTLTISNTILDEEFRTTQTGTADDNDVTVATYNASAFKTAFDALPAGERTPLQTSPTGFPQYAEKTNFVSSNNTVTNYFLTSSATGTPFPAGGVGTTLFVGANKIFLFATSNSDIIVGRVGNGTTADPGGAVALVIGIEETKNGSGVVTNADMWLVLRAPLIESGANLVDSADQLNLDNLVFLGSTYDTTTNIPFENFDGVPSGNNLFNVIFPSDGSTAVQLLLTGSTGESLSTVNVSSTGIGAGSQHIDVGYTLRIDTVSGMVKANVDSAPEVNNSGNIDYTDRVELSGADFEVTQLNPGSTPERVTVLVSAFNSVGKAQEGSYLTDAIAGDGVPVEIDAADVIVRNGAGQNITASLTITQQGSSVLIAGLDDGTTSDKTDGYQVFFTTDGIRFDRFLVTNMDGDGTTLDIGNIHVTAVQGGTDVEYADVGEHLIYQDDGPKISIDQTFTIPTLEVSDVLLNSDFDLFAGAFITDAGADSPGTVVYDVAVSSNGAYSGMLDSASGHAVFLFLEDNPDTPFVGDHKVVGRVGTGGPADPSAANGAVAFTISVDPAVAGKVIVDQDRAIFHTQPGNDTSISFLTNDLVGVTATIRDSETNADTASVSLPVGLQFSITDDLPTIDPSTDVNAPNNLVVKNLTTSAGQDSSFYVLDPGNDGLKTFSIVGPADTTGDFQWAYFNVDGVNGIEQNEIRGTYKGNPLYTLELENSGAYTFKMIGTLPSTPLELSSAEIKAGGPNTNSIDVGILGSDPRFVNIAATGGPINESNDNVGVTNGNFDTGEALTFALFNGATQLSFQGINIGTKSASGGTYGWTAHLVGGGTVTGADKTVPKNGTIVISPTDLGGALIDSITITKTSGSTTKIGIDDIDILVPPGDVQLSFSVRETDGDNDSVSANFTVSIDGNNDGSITNPVSAALLAPSLSLLGVNDQGDASIFA